MSHSDWVKAVKPGGPWDYKKAPIFARYADKDTLAQFGNWHYGFTGAANRMSLQMTLAGAGAAQVFLQKHQFSNVVNFNVTVFANMINPSIFANGDASATYGLRWGDNADDTGPIIQGYHFYENVYGK